MFDSVKRFIYRAVGLGRLRTEMNVELKAIRQSLEDLKLQASPAAPPDWAEFDAVLQRRLDEKLNYYFKWRFPLSIADHSSTLIHTNDGHRLYIDPKEPFMTIHLLEHGEWETPVRREIRQELAAGSTFVDIGANIGVHALFANMLVGPDGHVVAVEPHPVTRALLHKNLDINGMLGNTAILPYAISDVSDAVVAFEYFTEHPAMSGLKVAQTVLDRLHGTLETVNVNTLTLDELISRHQIEPDLIKVDVEGFEFSVLQGASQTIEDFPNVRFLIEYEKAMAESVLRPGVGAEIASFFQDRGFEVYKVAEDSRLKMTFEEFASDARGDYLFARP